jgi:hypothetical protein
LDTSYGKDDTKLKLIMSAYSDWEKAMKSLIDEGKHQKQVSSSESSPTQNDGESTHMDLLAIYWSCIGVAKRTDWETRITTTEKQRRGIKPEENSTSLLDDQIMTDESIPKHSDYDNIKDRISKRWKYKRDEDTGELNAAFINGWAVLDSEINDPSMPDPMSERPQRIYYKGTDDKSITADILKSHLHT